MQLITIVMMLLIEDDNDWNEDGVDILSEDEVLLLVANGVMMDVLVV